MNKFFEDLIDQKEDRVCRMVSFNLVKRTIFLAEVS